MINIEPGDRVTIKSTGLDGIIQWIDWDIGEVSIYQDGSYKVTTLDDIDPKIQRVLRPIADMTPEEMRQEIDLLRESRQIAISDSRKRSIKNRQGKGKGKATPKPPADPFDYLTPELKAKLQEKLKKAKEAKEE